MKIILFLLFFVLEAHAASYYVSTNGTSGGTGATNSTWDLQTAFNKVGVLVPGDTVWLRQGVYPHSPQGTNAGNEGYNFQILVAGSAGGQVTFRSYPGELASIDGGAYPGYHANSRPTIMMSGDYVTLQDLEIFSSSTEARLSGGDSSFPTDITRSDGPYAQRKGIKIINCYVQL